LLSEKERKRCQIKEKDCEEQYKEQQMNLCGEFLAHALSATRCL